MSDPSLLNILSVSTKITAKRSPDGPLFIPAFPSPLKFKWFPVSMPAGTFIFISLLVFVLPFPSHFLQTFLIIFPLPLHFGQVPCVTNVPNIVFLCCLIIPAPWHWLHVSSPKPPLPLHSLQFSILVSSTVFSVPKTASSKLIERSILRFAPLAGLAVPLPGPFPPKALKT